MRPLEDVRIVAVEQYGAGPFGSVHLADLGAEVIKIEDPRTGGDVGREVPPYAQDGDSLFFETFNRNKRSISLDLKAPLDQNRYQKDWTFSSRYDFNPFLYLKFEQHLVNGTAIGFSSLDNSNGLSTHFNMTLLKLGVSF